MFNYGTHRSPTDQIDCDYTYNYWNVEETAKQPDLVIVLVLCEDGS